MTNPAASAIDALCQLPTVPLPTTATFDLTATYHRWLDQVRRTTTSPAVQRLIDDVQGELSALGPIEPAVVEVVHGALSSITAAISAERAQLLAITRPTSTY